MNNLIFIAPPAAGKGTQSELLVKNDNYEHISTGDLLREEIASKSALGNEIESIIKSGNLVSDEIVTKLLTKELTRINKAFILDGYPRNITQANILEGILKKLNKKIDYVIYLYVDEDTATKRATGRLSCPNCHQTFHKYFAKPKIENICDNCGSVLDSRSDDTEETFKTRYNNYLKNTEPLLDYYKQKGLLVQINANKESNDIYKDIKK